MDINNITLKESAEIIYRLMQGGERKSLCEAYELLNMIFPSKYSLEEVKEYLFHHDLSYVKIYNQKIHNRLY